MSQLIVIKVGTGVLTKENGTLDGASLVRLVTAVAALQNEGYSCVMVSSGAVGAGVSALGLDAYPQDIDSRQAAAAVGQARLMQRYETLFGQFDLIVAQLLLSGSDFDHNRDRVCATAKRLLEDDRIIPIINENDSVAIEELRVGDNDMLSVKVAELLEADQLILLTTVDGLLDTTGQLVEEVRHVNEVQALVRDDSGKFSMGGMSSKLKSVEYASSRKIQTLIANGRSPEQLSEIVKGRGRCTRFPL